MSYFVILKVVVLMVKCEKRYNMRDYLQFSGANP